MKNQLSPLASIAVLLAIGLLGVVVVDTIIAMQEAEAASITGQCASAFKNATARLCPKSP